MRVPKLSERPTARQQSEQQWRAQNPDAPRNIIPDDKSAEANSASPQALQ